jgi:hypothetical protein
MRVGRVCAVERCGARRRREEGSEVSQSLVAARWPFAALASTAFVLVCAATASAAPPAVVHQTADGVAVDSPQGGGGPTMQLSAYAFRLVWEPPREIVSGTDIVLWIGKSGVQDTRCVPVTEDVLHLGPTPAKASLSGTFECRQGEAPTTFPLTVDLLWSGDVRDLQPSVFHWHGVGAGVQGGAMSGLQGETAVTGSVTDGTTEFLPEDARGRIVHASDTQVIPRP